jgi:hypothetical protein
LVISLLLNAVVIAILGGIAYIATLAGPIVVWSFMGGFFTCYILFKCWRFDYDPPPTISVQ